MGSKGKSKYDGQFSADQIINSWKIVSPKIKVDGEAKVLCRCIICNKTEKYISAFTLLKGTSKSCYRCAMNKQKGSGNPFWKGEGAIPGSMFKRAKDKKILAETWEKSGGVCALTGWPISIEEKTASPDRIDSTKGYTVDNIQWVHRHVNIAKNMFDLEHFLSICHAVARNNQDPGILTNSNKFGAKII